MDERRNWRTVRGSSARTARRANTGISRRRFLKTTGIAVAGAGAAAAGLAGVAKAAPGDMTIDVYPSGTGPYTGKDGLLQAIADVADGGTVMVHYGEYNLGPDQMLIDKSINLVGVPNASGEKPEIIGQNSTPIGTAQPGNPNLPVSEGGMIAIKAPGANVVIRDLHIVHNENYSNRTGTFVNYGSASFHLDKCDVDTSATSACITMELNEDAPPGRSVKVTGCEIMGSHVKITPQLWIGNNSCVNVSSFSPYLPNLRGGLLEVSDCVLESGLFIGLGAFGFQSDSNTRVLVEGNEIGLINEGTGSGIGVGNYAPNLPNFSQIRGDIRITRNSIRLSKFLYIGVPPLDPYFAVGITVAVEADAHNAAHTLIADNDIEMSVKGLQQAKFHHAAIPYFDYTPEAFASNTSADIRGNNIVSNPDNLPAPDPVNGTEGFIPPKFGIEAGSTDFLFTFIPGKIINANISHNNLKDMEAAINQLWLPAGSFGNVVKNNDWGHAQVSGILVSGNNNTFVNENFWGPYSGVNQGNPCMWFEENTFGNVVSAIKKGQALQGFDLCNQILNEEPEHNTIRGYKKCQSVPNHVLLAMLKRMCEKDGGTWDNNTNTCSYPEYGGGLNIQLG